MSSRAIKPHLPWNLSKDCNYLHSADNKQLEPIASPTRIGSTRASRHSARCVPQEPV